MAPIFVYMLFGAAGPAPGEFVVYPSGKDNVRGFLCRPEGTGPFPAVVIVHGDYGLGDHEKQLARRLARNGYIALGVDLYRGAAVTDLIDAHIMDRGLPESQVLGDIKAAVSYLAGRRDVRPSAMGIFGWDMGGGYALDVARREPRLKAVVTCYGRLTTEATLLAPLEASVFGIFAGQDAGITPATIEQYRKAMQAAGKRVAGLHTYPDCPHGFLNPRPEIAGKTFAGAAADAWKRIDAYLAAELK